MKPGSELGDVFKIDDAAQEALREHQLYIALQTADIAFDSFPSASTNNLVAARLAGGAYNPGELRDLIAKGEVTDIRISPAYDAYEPEEMPGSVIVSRCQRIIVRPGSSLLRRKNALTKPSCVYYVFGIQPDLAEFHSQADSVDDIDSDSPYPTTITLDQTRFARTPSSSGVKFGILRRGDELACFRIDGNPGYAEIIPVFAGSGSFSVGDERPQLGPIDQARQKLIGIPLSPDLCGTLLNEVEKISALHVPTPQRHRRLRLPLGKVSLKPRPHE